MKLHLKTLFLALVLSVSFQDTYRLYAAETLSADEDLDSYFENVDKPAAKASEKPEKDDELTLEEDSDAKSDSKNAKVSKKKMALDPDVEAAQSLYQARDFKGVIASLSPKTESLGRLGFYYLGRSYSQLKQHEAALRTYQLALGKDEKDGEFKALYGQELGFLKRNKEAKRALREALDLKPTYKPAYRIMIDILESENNKTDTRNLYTDMIKYFGEKKEYINQLCRLSYSEALFDLAMNYCNRGIVLDPEEPSNHVYLTLTRKIKGDIKTANQDIKKIAAKFPQSYLVQIEFAKSSEKSGNFVDAYQGYKQAAEIDPKQNDAVVGLAVSAFELQKYDEAYGTYEKICATNRHVWPQLRKSINYLQTNKMDAMLKKFTSLLERCAG